jgi:hypothetical protein
LINRYEFKDYVEKYGEVVAVSNNGQNFVLRKPSTKIAKIFDFAILHMGLFGVTVIK